MGVSTNNGKFAPDQSIVAQACDGGRHQQWSYDRHTEQLKLVGTDFCLDAYHGRDHNGNTVVLYKCQTGTNQKWHFD